MDINYIASFTIVAFFYTHDIKLFKSTQKYLIYNYTNNNKVGEECMPKR